MVPELGQLSPQSQIRVHQERLSTTLVEILERQSCTCRKIIYLKCNLGGKHSLIYFYSVTNTCIQRVVFVFQLKLYEQFEDSSAKKRDMNALMEPKQHTN